MSRKTWEGEVPFFIQTQAHIDAYKAKYGDDPSPYMQKYFTELSPGTEMSREAADEYSRVAVEVLHTHVGGRVEMRRVEPFQAPLRYHSYYQGRAKVGVIWQDEATGTLYPMAMQCLDEYLKRRPFFVAGAAFDTWRVVKLSGGYFSLAADVPTA